MSEIRSVEVEKILKSMSKLVGYDLTKLDINNEYTLNIFLSNPSSFLDDKEVVKKVKEINEVLQISNEIIRGEGGQVI